MTFTGGCLCGTVRYESTGEPLGFALCHCRDCQYISGGEPASVVILSQDGVEVTSGTLSGYSKAGASGRQVTREFCPTCGTHVFSRLDMMPGFIGLKAGTMDDPATVAPSMMVWTDSALPWAHRPEGVACFTHNPPVA